MKKIGTYKGIPIYSSPDVPSGVIYIINKDNFKIDYPKRKDGKLDMRFTINKLKVLFKMR